MKNIKKIRFAQKGLEKLMLKCQKACHAKGCKFPYKCPVHCPRCRNKKMNGSPDLNLNTAIMWMAASEIKKMICSIEIFNEIVRVNFHNKNPRSIISEFSMSNAVEQLYSIQSYFDTVGTLHEVLLLHRDQWKKEFDIMSEISSIFLTIELRAFAIRERFEFSIKDK